MVTTRLSRACAAAGVLIAIGFVIGCGNNAAKVVKAPKSTADEPTPATTEPATVPAKDVVASPPAKPYSPPVAEPPPAPKANKWTKAQFDKVKLGMSADQVKGILGAAMFESGNGNSVNMQWAEPDVAQSIHIVFENGKVLHKTAAGLGPIKEKVTKANLEKIRTGTPEATVFELLGPGSSESEMSNGKAFTWEANGMNVLIQTEKGKVVNKMVFKK
jgi:hypothetical protein